MALGDGGVDAQVRQRMDAYRSNPQQLKQRYGQNKELLDLLALQKLTSEKKQVAADMQLKQQQQPGTIAQQREQEALGLIKQEMGGTLGDLRARTAGTLNQKGIAQRQNVQRVVQGKPRPPAGIAGLPGLMGNQQRRTVDPRTSGISNVRKAQAMQQPVPTRMAQGGIVGFAGGRGVEGTGDYPELGGTELTTERLMALKKAYPRDYLRYAKIIKDNPDGIPFYTLPPLVQDKISELFNIRRELTDADLRRLESGADPSGMDTEEGSGFELDPIQATERLTDPVSEIVTPKTAAPDTFAESMQKVNNQAVGTGSTGSVTFPVPEQEPTAVSLLTRDDLTATPVAPAAASSAGVDTAQAELNAAIDGILPSKIDPETADFIDLESIPASDYLNETGTDARNKILTEAYENVDRDVSQERADALATADAYSLRDAKNETARQQIQRQEDFNARNLAPGRVDQLKRLETFGGGAKYGRGGIGEAFVEAERRFSKLEEEGLKSLAELEDKAIVNDNALVRDGIGMGNNQANITANAITGGLNALQSEIDRQKQMALDQQDKQQSVNLTNTQLANDVLVADYKAKAAANRKIADAKMSALKAEIAERTDLTNVSIADAEAQTKANIANAKVILDQAIEQDKNTREYKKLAGQNYLTLLELFQTQSSEVYARFYELLDEDPTLKNLRMKFDMTENDKDLADLQKRINLRQDELESTLTLRFAPEVARLSNLADLVDQERQQMGGLGAPTTVNPADTIVEELSGNE